MENIGFLFYHYDENENELKVTPRGRNVMVLTGILGCTVTKKNLVQ